MGFPFRGGGGWHFVADLRNGGKSGLGRRIQHGPLCGYPPGHPNRTAKEMAVMPAHRVSLIALVNPRRHGRQPEHFKPKGMPIAFTDKVPGLESRWGPIGPVTRCERPFSEGTASPVSPTGAPEASISGVFKRLRSHGYRGAEGPVRDAANTRHIRVRGRWRLRPDR